MNAIPEPIQTRFGAQVAYEEGIEVRMGVYADGTLRIGGFGVTLSGPFASSPDGRYLAGTRHFDTVAVVVDLKEQKEKAFIIGRDVLRLRDFHDDAFWFDHEFDPKTGEAMKQSALTLEFAFGEGNSVMPSDFTRLSGG